MMGGGGRQRALIGHTGFVGGELGRQASFDVGVNSATIDAIRGRSFDLVVCAGAPGRKWLANREPEADLASIERLERALAEVEARRVVLISTVDVYPEPQAVDEATRIDPAAGTPYGRHRLRLEHFVATRFHAVVIRLPGLFGRGLRKNALYDLLHGHQVDRIDRRGVYQFYDLSRAWTDIERAASAGLQLVNFATEPIAITEVAEACFGRTLAWEGSAAPPHYDMRSRHAAVLGGRDGYLYDRTQVLEAMRRFVAEESARLAGGTGT